MNRRAKLKQKTQARRRRQNQGMPGLKGTGRTEKPSLTPKAWSCHCVPEFPRGYRFTRRVHPPIN